MQILETILELSFKKTISSILLIAQRMKPLGKTDINTSKSKNDMELLDFECEEVLGLL